jgi:hypothetical protein
MNRVLNKGFASESYLNSALISFSDVFHPASRMQSCHAGDSKGHHLASFGMFSLSGKPHLHPTPGNR